MTFLNGSGLRNKFLKYWCKFMKHYISHMQNTTLLNLTLKIWKRKGSSLSKYDSLVSFICIFPYLIQIVQNTLFAFNFVFIQSSQYSVLVYIHKYYFCSNNKYLNENDITSWFMNLHYWNKAVEKQWIV